MHSFHFFEGSFGRGSDHMHDNQVTFNPLIVFEKNRNEKDQIAQRKISETRSEE